MTVGEVAAIMTPRYEQARAADEHGDGDGSEHRRAVLAEWDRMLETATTDTPVAPADEVQDSADRAMAAWARRNRPASREASPQPRHAPEAYALADSSGRTQERGAESSRNPRR